MNDDETFHHLALDCPGTRQLRQQFFGNEDILHNMAWDVHTVLEFSYAEEINELLDPNDVHEIRLDDTGSEGDSSREESD